MLDKLKKMFLRGVSLAEFLEENGKLDEAYEEYLKVVDYKRAGKILEKKGKWHQAANLYIKANEVDHARRAVEQCLRRDENWETYELDGNNKIAIEDWLKQHQQVRRFVRYVRHMETLDKKGIPLVVLLAHKLKQVLEFKSAAELYEKGFDLINREREAKNTKSEVWLRYAAECYSKVKMYPETAKVLKKLIITEVNIGDTLPISAANPYRNYIPNLKMAKEWNVLPQLLDILGDFDPFNVSYDLLKMDEPELSMEVFFKYYGKVLKKTYSDIELEIRNKRMQYCLNQYIIYYRERREYAKAAEIAILNSQREIAAELYQKAIEEERRSKSSGQLKVENMETLKEPKEDQKKDKATAKKEIFKCPICGEIVEPDWEICPNCDGVLYLDMCVCGQKIKPHWQRCPACKRPLNQPPKEKTSAGENANGDNDTKPVKPLLQDF